jgi:hypothetical protein
MGCCGSEILRDLALVQEDLLVLTGIWSGIAIRIPLCDWQFVRSSLVIAAAEWGRNGSPVAGLATRLIQEHDARYAGSPCAERDRLHRVRGGLESRRLGDDLTIGRMQQAAAACAEMR